MAAEFDLEALLELMPVRQETQAVPAYPPILEDIAMIIDEATPAGKIEATIRQAGGTLLTKIRLFDVYHGEQVGQGKKSLAYSMTYQALDRTLTDKDATQIRQRIINALETELGAKIRSQ